MVGDDHSSAIDHPYCAPRGQEGRCLLSENLQLSVEWPFAFRCDRSILFEPDIQRSTSASARSAVPLHAFRPEMAAYSARMKATRSFFSCSINFNSNTRLKNSTVSSSVSNRSSCRYGGESLMPRSGKVLIGPSADALRPLMVTSLKNRSTFKLCMRLSV